MRRTKGGARGLKHGAGRPRRIGLAGVLLGLGAISSACARGPHPRHQHLIDDTLVVSPAARPSDYAAYLRIRLALDTPNGDLDAAKKDMDTLLRRRPGDPHLWTTKAELEYRRGDDDAGREALDHVFALEPDYGPARVLQAKLASGDDEAADL